MEQVLVEVTVPMINNHYDVYLPCDMKLELVTELLAELFKNMACCRLETADRFILCELPAGKPLPVNQTVRELGILNGGKLLLM